jgi:nucleoside-diphosphate-sugar epimerase
MSRPVVFGTGQIGRLVTERLVSLGADVTAVNRTGRGSVAGARVVAGDATDPAFTTGVCAGTDVVYFCLNAPHYDNWAREFPPLQQGCWPPPKLWARAWSCWTTSTPTARSAAAT